MSLKRFLGNFYMKIFVAKPMATPPWKVADPGVFDRRHEIFRSQ